ncbi:mechanosensitive ion channel protein [Phyllobacterium phragmitis]|uniref:Mechanosensitive ion channel protein n=1 Tax=Phyllobacterium phragmitis TaxID=2670329 RepID=A0A2S9IX69_9HYPH|nr:mechanosensitive ion channel family protein [Phyllobacterium phragmitis]PRD45122.1 mechanosensitive ion channel protein [Phyllobacterium phragmitis]
MGGSKLIFSGKLSKFLFVFAIFFAFLAPVSHGFAQQNIIAEQRPIIDSLKKQTADLSGQMAKASTSDEELADLRLQMEGVTKKLLGVGLAFRPRLTEINARLEQLGPAPAQGQPAEPAIVTDERNRLTGEKAQINAMIGETEDSSVTVNQMIERIGEMRRELFTRTLSQRVDINYSLGSQVVGAAGYETQKLGRRISSWWRFVLSFKLKPFLAAAFFALAAALVLHFGARRFLGDLFLRDPTVEAPSYLSRLSAAFWSTLIPSAAVGVFLGTTYFFLDYFNVLRTDIAKMLSSLFSVIVIVYFIHRLAKAVLCSDMPNWRLVHIAPKPARVLTYLITTTALINGLDYFLNTVNQVLASPLSLTVAKSLLATVLVGLLIIAIAWVKPLEQEETGAVRPWPKALRVFLICLGLFPIVAALLGYIGLARFASQQIVVNGAFLVTMYLGFLTARAITAEQAFGSTSVGRAMQQRFGMDETSLDQLGLVAGILTNFVVLLIGVPLILLQLGFQWSELQTWFLRLMTGFQVGNFSISFTSIFTGLLLFVIGYFITRWFQNWLDGSVMARGRVDSGVRNSIRTVVGYLGLALAALVGISAAGINLSNLALVAGGLSLGIGFGLQNVVSNFVSGLILLVERPIKVGDWVEAGGVAGIVKKISVRATEVETFQRQSIIVPNSSLINDNVANWTHRNKLGRADIPIGAAYGSDPRKVHALLLDIGRSHPQVLKNPEPFVAFKGFGDSSLDFELRVFLSDISSIVLVENELRFLIVEKFAEEGIEIPFPQRDINLRVEQIEAIADAIAARKSQPKVGTGSGKGKVTAGAAKAGIAGIKI